MNFNLGNNAPTTKLGITLGSPSVQTAPGGSGDAKAPLPSLVTQTPQAKLTGTVAPQSFTSQSPGFSFGQTPTTSTSISLSSTPITTSSGFNLGTPFNLTSTASAAPTLQTSTSAAPASFNFSSPLAPTTLSATVPTTPSFFGTPASTSTSSVLKLGLQTPAVTTTTPASISTALTPSSTATTIASAIPAQLSSINFSQLQTTINKWKIELEDQEKLFINQATQVKTWDQLLISNSEKIVTLDKEVMAMKLQQQQLDNELEFILSQQGELEECLTSLEKDVGTMLTDTDPERENIYTKAESMDTQLKQMSEDLKEIIEQLNESSRSQDTSDPIVQIGRILNAHMNSLQWIDQNTTNIQTQLDSVSKLHDLHCRDSERSFRLTYD